MPIPEAGNGEIGIQRENTLSIQTAATDDPANVSGLESLVDSEIAVMPEPTDASKPEAEVEDSDREPESPSIFKDSAGTIFNPAYHSIDSEGKPTTTKTGKFRKKRGSQIPSNVRETNLHQQSVEIGKFTADAIFALGQAIGGEEWEPEIDSDTGMNEYANMVSSWSAYYAATGRNDIPPGVAVAITVLAYALPRLVLPKTRSRLTKAIQWLKSKGKKRA